MSRDTVRKDMTKSPQWSIKSAIFFPGTSGSHAGVGKAGSMSKRKPAPDATGKDIASPVPPRPCASAKQKRRASDVEAASQPIKKRKQAGGSQANTAEAGRDMDGNGSLHPFEHDPADDCETCFQAYQDIAPFLNKLAQRLGKSKKELCIWDPYYCAGKVKKHLRKLGFTNVVNENKDFYALTPAEYPPFDVLLTSPPYSKDHIQRCIQFAVSSKRAWFILQPQYVHRKAYFSGLIAGLDPFFMVPGREYVYFAHHGGRKDNTTVLCRHWARDGKCPLGDKCMFSHGSAREAPVMEQAARDKPLVPVTPFKSIWHIHFGVESGGGNKKKASAASLNDKMYTWAMQKV